MEGHQVPSNTFRIFNLESNSNNNILCYFQGVFSSFI